MKVKELEKQMKNIKSYLKSLKAMKKRKEKIDEEIKPEMSRFNSSRDVNKLEKKNKVLLYL